MRTFALSVITTLFFAFAATAHAETDITPPKVSNLSLTNKIFKVGTKNTALAAKAKKKKTPKGTTIKFELEESAYILIGVYKALEGRRAGTDCVKPNAENEKAEQCVRPVHIDTMQRIGKPGPNAVSFSGKLDGKTLKPGAYGFGVMARDALLNSTPIVLKLFWVVKR